MLNTVTSHYSYSMIMSTSLLSCACVPVPQHTPVSYPAIHIDISPIHQRLPNSHDGIDRSCSFIRLLPCLIFIPPSSCNGLCLFPFIL